MIEQKPRGALRMWFDEFVRGNWVLVAATALFFGVLALIIWGSIQR